MRSAAVARLHDWLRAQESALLDDYRTLLRFPSIEDAALPNAPFGQANRDALDFMLGKADGWGMRTKDLEGYLGWAEFGQGERLVMVLGHLDVVPVGPGWEHEPFGAEIDGDYVYARGAVDDKGPTMAAFYAARAIQECFPEIGARIRCAFGCNEESGFHCVERYMQTEEVPTYGVAPDSGWPLYHAEKGIANLMVRAPRPGAPFELLEISGGQRANIVIDATTAHVRVAAELRAEIEAKLAKSWDRNLDTHWDGDVLVVEAHGKAAHGSVPFYGDSAMTRALRLLRELTPASLQGHYEALFELGHPGGFGLGIQGADEVSGGLSANVGVVETRDDAIWFKVNIRYPVTWKYDEMAARCRAHFERQGEGLTLDSGTDSPPLFFPLEHPLVRTICEVVEVETGERRAPGVMGGGTYARAVPNTVSIGTGWAGDGPAHETDERLKVEHLFKMSRIYAHILYRLATDPA